MPTSWNHVNRFSNKLHTNRHERPDTQISDWLYSPFTFCSAQELFWLFCNLYSFTAGENGYFIAVFKEISFKTGCWHTFIHAGISVEKLAPPHKVLSGTTTADVINKLIENSERSGGLINIFFFLKKGTRPRYTSSMLSVPCRTYHCCYHFNVNYSPCLGSRTKIRL